jgi:hypothetical protein
MEINTIHLISAGVGQRASKMVAFLITAKLKAGLRPPVILKSLEVQS